MKVVTENPVVINKTRISEPSKYLSFDGNNKMEVQAFQDWMDFTYPTWYKGGKMNRKRTVYGRMTKATRAAAAKYGNQFDQASRQAMGGGRGMIGTVNPITGEFTPPPPEGYTMQSPTGETRVGQFWNKAQGGWEKTQTAFQKVQGFMDKAGAVMDMFGQGGQRVTPDWQQTQPMTTMDTNADRRMSRGAKIALIVGGVAAAGFIGYMIYRYSKKGKGGKK